MPGSRTDGRRRSASQHARIAGGRSAIRSLDPEECGIVAYEFDAAFRRLDETFVHIGEWLEEARDESSRATRPTGSG